MTPLALAATDARYPARLRERLGEAKSPQLAVLGNLNFLALPKTALPDGGAFAPPTRRRIDGTMVKALARAFRWRKLLENGRYATVGDLASAEKINTSYVSRVLRLTLLAPDIVETIMDGHQPATMKMADLLEPFPVEWPAQRARLTSSRNTVLSCGDALLFPA